MKTRGLVVIVLVSFSLFPDSSFVLVATSGYMMNRSSSMCGYLFLKYSMLSILHLLREEFANSG